MRNFSVFLVLVAMFLLFLFAGFSVGALDGSHKACKSIGLEWVKDKCMKVTREAV